MVYREFLIELWLALLIYTPNCNHFANSRILVTLPSLGLIINEATVSRLTCYAFKPSNKKTVSKMNTSYKGEFAP